MESQGQVQHFCAAVVLEEFWFSLDLCCCYKETWWLGIQSLICASLLFCVTTKKQWGSSPYPQDETSNECFWECTAGSLVSVFSLSAARQQRA